MTSQADGFTNLRRAYPRIGSDESGKGDYFGPLVIAAVCVRDADDEKFLRDLGVRDSKRVSDKRCMEAAASLRRRLPHAVVQIGPARYNELYRRIGNLNRLLGWAHARALEDVARLCPAATLAVTDKFGDDAYVEQCLMARGRRLRLCQRVRAEDDVAVAAASLVARAVFLERLKWLEREAGFPLPKGAAAGVEEAARRVLQAEGREGLARLVKLHFRTTERL